VALRRPDPDLARAETCFNKAIEVARGQDARLLELRAATDLGRLWQGNRRAGEIRALVEPILRQIEGGATAPDVCNARTLLATLG
jgi:predicted ATPase